MLAGLVVFGFAPFQRPDLLVFFLLAGYFDVQMGLSMLSRVGRDGHGLLWL